MNPASLIGHVVELCQLQEDNTQPADRIIGKFFRERKYLGSHDRRFISEFVFGIIRHRRFIEALFERYLDEHKGAEDLNISRKRYLPLCVVYATAVAQESVTIGSFESLWKTSFPGHDLRSFGDFMLSHKTLAFLPEDRAVQLGVKYSFQDWMVEEWIEQLGNEAESLLSALNSSANTTLRVNLMKTTREECQKRLQEEGIETMPTAISPSGLVAQKRFQAQSSQTFR